MFVPHSIDQSKGISECLPKAQSIISDSGQTAAPFRTIQRESADNGMPSDLQASHEPIDVSGPLVLIGKEVKRCAIMPNVVFRLDRPPDGNVCDNPMNVSGAIAKTLLGCLQCSTRPVERSNIQEFHAEKVVNETGRPCANVDDRGSWPGADLPQ